MVATRLLIIVLSFSSISASIYTCDPTISCGCSTSSTVVTSRIIGGEAAANYSWGWMGSLQENVRHICGASLLTSEYAITAAHCVLDPSVDSSLLWIVVGTNYRNDVNSTTIQRRKVINFTTHSNYNPVNLDNDIAILQFLPLTISSSSKLAFICLPTANQDPFTINSSLIAIGWGYTDEQSYTISNSLQQVTVQVYSSRSDECIQSHIANSSLQFCAGISEGGKDTCQGDSGGPLMAFVNNRWVLAGITSFGDICAQPGFLGVYTRVSTFISFIQSSTNFLGLGTTTVTAITSTNQSSANGGELNTRCDHFTFIFSAFVIFILIKNQ